MMRSYFKFTKKQRNGIFLLVLVIFGLQVSLFLIKNKKSKFTINEAQHLRIQNEIDSLKRLKSISKPEIFPFNPNYIDDFKGYSLGMSIEEIDRLHEYRMQNKWINSVDDFQFL